MFSQQGKKLLIETHFLVMRFLILDVSNNQWSDGCAHAKCPVTLLPCELESRFSSPPRGIRLDGFHCLCNRQHGRNLDKQMNVVLRPSHAMNANSQLLTDARDVSPQSGLQLLVNGLGSLFVLNTT